MSDLDLLELMISTPGVSGREDLIRAVIRAAVAQRACFDDIEQDVMGNLICRRRGRGSQSGRKILLAAHMDQAGFLVSHISDEGMLSLHPVGTYDLRSLASQPVSVLAQKSELLAGSIQLAAHPVHTASTEQTSAKPVLSDFYVDLGLPAAEVRAKVRLGDMVAFRTPMERLGNAIVGAGLDNRIGCWALIEALTAIRNENDDVICVFTVQEELGSRGAVPVARSVAPDIAIICESVVSCCLPGVSPSEHVTIPEGGIALQVADSSLLSDMALIELAETAAKGAGLSVQRSLMQGGGQDGAIIQRSGPGVRTLALGCPVKFMHTSREQANLADVTSYPSLIAAILNKI